VAKQIWTGEFACLINKNSTEGDIIINTAAHSGKNKKKNKNGATNQI